MSFHIGDKVVVSLPGNIRNYAEQKQKYNNTTAIITDLRYTSVMGYIYILNNDKNIYFRESELSKKSRLQSFLEESIKNEKNLEKDGD